MKGRVLKSSREEITQDDPPNDPKEQHVYGHELVLDLHGCDVELFKREHIKWFLNELCDLIEMQMCEVHFWDDLGVPFEEQQSLPHTKGTSAVCFILTSSIVVHTLELLGSAYVNIFSCKSFDPSVASAFAKKFFAATSLKSSFLERTLKSEK